MSERESGDQMKLSAWQLLHDAAVVTSSRATAARSTLRADARISFSQAACACATTRAGCGVASEAPASDAAARTVSIIGSARRVIDSPLVPRRGRDDAARLPLLRRSAG